MAMTTIPQDVENPSAATPVMEPPSDRRALFGWFVVAVALVAATVLVVLAQTGDDPAEPQPWYSVEHGSIAAIDHAAEAVEAANQPSIAAADHAAAPSAQTPAEVSAAHGSTSAIDHAAADDAGEDDTTGAG
jgi:hypothetical protein